MFVHILTILCVARRGRGHARGNKIERLVRKSGKLKVDYSLSDLQVTGDNAYNLAATIGIIVRGHCPVDASGWRNVSKEVGSATAVGRRARSKGSARRLPGGSRRQHHE